MTASFVVGDRVRLKSQPPYIKTADTMPMLRPGDVIPLGEEGIILAQKAAGYWSVKFARGAFLIDNAYLERVDESIAETADGPAEKSLPSDSEESHI